MTRRIVPFQRWHVGWLQEDGMFRFDFGTLQTLEQQNSWTAVVDGDPIACGGTIQQWPGRHIAWMYLNSKTGPHMRFLTAEVLKGLRQVQGRIELTVRQDFAAGHRWARILGFVVETPLLRGYGPEGENHVGYVRFN